jgi:hypothetical protein
MKLPFIPVAGPADNRVATALRDLCYYQDFRYVSGAGLAAAVCSRVRAPVSWEIHLCLPHLLFGTDRWYSAAADRMNWYYIDVAAYPADEDLFRRIKEKRECQ